MQTTLPAFLRDAASVTERDMDIMEERLNYTRVEEVEVSWGVCYWSEASAWRWWLTDATGREPIRSRGESLAAIAFREGGKKHRNKRGRRKTIG